MFDGIELTEWRLTGPALMSLIVFLNMRMRMRCTELVEVSRPRILRQAQHKFENSCCYGSALVLSLSKHRTEYRHHQSMYP